MPCISYCKLPSNQTSYLCGVGTSALSTSDIVSGVIFCTCLVQKLFLHFMTYAQNTLQNINCSVLVGKDAERRYLPVVAVAPIAVTTNRSLPCVQATV